MCWWRSISPHRDTSTTSFDSFDKHRVCDTIRLLLEEGRVLVLSVIAWDTYKAIEDMGDKRYVHCVI
jgi:hypothetical protein